MKKEIITIRFIRLVVISNFILVLCLSLNARASVEGGAYSFNPARATDRCEERAGSEINLEISAAAWHNKLVSHGWDMTWDTYLYASELTDANKVYWGKDHLSDNLDTVDAILLNTHGNYSDFIYFLTTSNYNNQTTGQCINGSCDCLVSSNDMSVGNTDAEFFHTPACHSAQWEIVSSGIFPAMHYRLHQYGGMNGTSYIADGVEDFADDAFDEPIVWAWHDNMERRDIGSRNYHQCPISMVQGDDWWDSYYRRNNERYDSTYTDPSSGATVTFFISCGCDPNDGSPAC